MWTLARQEKRKERKKKGGGGAKEGKGEGGAEGRGRAERGEGERSSKPTRCFMFLFCLGRLGLPDKVPDRVHPRRKHPAVTAFEKQVQSEEKKIISPRLKLTKLLCVCVFLLLSPRRHTSQRAAAQCVKVQGRDQTREVVVGKNTLMHACTCTQNALWHSGSPSMTRHFLLPAAVWTQILAKA